MEFKVQVKAKNNLILFCSFWRAYSHVICPISFTATVRELFKFKVLLSRVYKGIEHIVLSILMEKQDEII